MDSTFDKVLCFICSIRSIKVTREFFKHFEMLTMGYRTDFLKTYPQMVDQSGSIPIEYSWSGLMGYAEHMMPEIGPLEKDLWACTNLGGDMVSTLHRLELGLRQKDSAVRPSAGVLLNPLAFPGMVVSLDPSLLNHPTVKCNLAITGGPSVPVGENNQHCL